MAGETLWVAFDIDGDLPRLLGVFSTEEEVRSAGDDRAFVVVDKWTMRH